MIDTNTTLTPWPDAGAWRPAFLASLRNWANVRAACHAAGIHRATAYAHREADAAFRAAWDDALEDACDLLEAAARGKAYAGDGDMIRWLLKAHRRRIYGDRLDVTIAVQREAERLAAEQGVPLDDVLAEIDMMFNPVRGER
jgi:hypothetical protein